MYTFKANIGSLTSPSKGSGYIQVYPITEKNGLVKKRDNKYFSIVRTEVKENLLFKQDEYRAFKELYDEQESSLELKIYYSGVEVWYGYLLLSGDFDEDNQTCKLETQVIDQYSELQNNLDKDTNIVSFAQGTAKLQYIAYVFTLTLPCFVGSRGEAEFYYDPNGEVSDNPLDSHVDWAYYAEAGEIDCEGGAKQYIYKTAVLNFPADGFTQSTLTPSLWLQASTVDVPVLITLNRVASLFDVLENLLNKADNSIFINESTYSDYINNPTNLIDNLKIMDKSDAKRNESTDPATFEMMTVKNILELYKDWFDLSYKLDSDKNFTLNRKGDLLEKDYEENPQYDLTTYKSIDFTNNQKKYSFGLDQIPNKETIEFEKCNRAWFDKAKLTFDSYSGKTNEKTWSSFNNNIDYIRFDPEEVSDNGFCVLSCNIAGVVRSQQTLNGSNQTNGGMSAHLLLYNHLLDNRNFTTGKIDGYPVTCDRGKFREITYKNIPIHNIEDIDFDYYIKTNLGLAEPQELEISFDGGFATLKTVI